MLMDGADLQIQQQVHRRSGLELDRKSSYIERALGQHSFLVLAILSLIYFGGTILRARAKPFWFDEIFTLLAANQPSISATLKAARELDWTPPFTDLIVHFMNGLAGSGEIVSRIPSMVGFWVFCLCLFGFAVRRVSILFALAAMLLPFAAESESYSFEARSYGILLGFCGIALFSWQSAAAGRRRALALVGLSAGIAGALLSHSYGVLIFIPLAGAEAFRSFRQRRIDWPLWAAIAVGALPMVLLLLQVTRVAKVSTHPWSVAQRVDYRLYYSSEFGSSLWFLIPALTSLAAWFVAGGNKEEPAGARQPSIPDYEILAAVLLLLVPVAGITLALVLPPHIFHYRYVIPSIGGFALLVSFLVAQAAGKRSAIGMAFAVPAFLVFGFHLIHVYPFQNPLDREPLLRDALQDGPVVINDYVAYLQFWYYAPENLKPRLLYLSDEESSVKYSHCDDVMGPVAQFVPSVLRYKDFAVPGREFMLYFNPGFGWVPEKVLDDGGTLQALKWDQGRAVLFRARVK
jgi:hypothetical protein